MTSRAWCALALVGKIALSTVRFALFVTLLVVGRVLRPILALATAGGILALIGGLIFRHQRPEMLAAGACIAVGSVALQLLYDMALQALAPPDTVIVSEL